MSKLSNRFKRAIKATVRQVESHSYVLSGMKIVCTHCGHDQFDQGSALLNTAGMTFLHLDWANREATILACKKCGCIRWFLNRPEKEG